MGLRGENSDDGRKVESAMKRPALLYYAPFTRGGLADYAHEQASALQRLGVDVTVLTAPGFSQGREVAYGLQESLVVRQERSQTARWLGRLQTASTILKNNRILARVIEAQKHAHVLLGSYAEYLAPLWAGTFRRMADCGVVFGAVVHDPVRDYMVGPEFWHRRSVADGYSYLREAFVHEAVTLATFRPMPGLHTTVIPHGPYPFPAATLNREAMRKKMALPDAAVVLLAFGYLRDNKNLHLALQALCHNQEIHLLVAGQEQSAGQRNFEYYQNLARQLGVESRCRWERRFIPREEAGNYFEACDYVLLAYGAAFRSASGVLNAAAWFRKPCLASAGGSNLKSVVQRYGLGLWSEPDDLDCLSDAFRKCTQVRLRPDWEAYEKDHSWEQNAVLVRDHFFGG